MNPRLTAVIILVMFISRASSVEQPVDKLDRGAKPPTSTSPGYRTAPDITPHISTSASTEIPTGTPSSSPSFSLAAYKAITATREGSFASQRPTGTSSIQSSSIPLMNAAIQPHKLSFKVTEAPDKRSLANGAIFKQATTVSQVDFGAKRKRERIEESSANYTIGAAESTTISQVKYTDKDASHVGNSFVQYDKYSSRNIGETYWDRSEPTSPSILSGPIKGRKSIGPRKQASEAAMETRPSAETQIPRNFITIKFNESSGGPAGAAVDSKARNFSDGDKKLIPNGGDVAVDERGHSDVGGWQGTGRALEGDGVQGEGVMKIQEEQEPRPPGERPNGPIRTAKLRAQDGGSIKQALSSDTVRLTVNPPAGAPTPPQLEAQAAEKKAERVHGRKTNVIKRGLPAQPPIIPPGAVMRKAAVAVPVTEAKTGAGVDNGVTAAAAVGGKTGGGGVVLTTEETSTRAAELRPEDEDGEVWQTTPAAPAAPVETTAGVQRLSTRELRTDLPGSGRGRGRTAAAPQGTTIEPPTLPPNRAPTSGLGNRTHPSDIHASDTATPTSYRHGPFTTHATDRHRSSLTTSPTAHPTSPTYALPTAFVNVTTPLFDLQHLQDLVHRPSETAWPTTDVFAFAYPPDGGNGTGGVGTAGRLPQEIPWPVKREAVVEGDIVLGGLMMVHEREDSVTCGPVMPQGGVQALEAMLYTLDRLNLAPEPLLPNVSLGAHILDDCDKDTYGLEMAVDFIKGESMLEALY